MKISKGSGSTIYGAGILIELDGSEAARAIDVWLYSQGVIQQGPRTIRCNGELFGDQSVTVYVDPSGFVIVDGEKIDGKTGEKVISSDDCGCGRGEDCPILLLGCK